MARCAIRPLGFWRVDLAEKSNGVATNCTAPQITKNIATLVVDSFNQKCKIGKQSKNIVAQASKAPTNQCTKRSLLNKASFSLLVRPTRRNIKFLINRKTGALSCER